MPSLPSKISLIAITGFFTAAFLSDKVSAETITEAAITEFLANNDRGLEDEDGDNSDWIEVWNTSGVDGDLNGWYLTDDLTNLTKWQFPAVEITSGERLIVFASAKNRSDPEQELHTNFSLTSSEGGSLALVRPDGITIAQEFSAYPEQFEDISFGLTFGEPVAETLVEEGDFVRFLVPSGPVTDWFSTDFDDSSWTSTTTGVGFDSSTKYRPFFGANNAAFQAAMEDINGTAYLRIPFQATEVASLNSFILTARWEDGFIAYLNGEEIHRERAPDNATWNSTSLTTPTIDEDIAITLQEYPLTTGSLIEGENILAVQLLNQNVFNNDLLFSPQFLASRSDLSVITEGFYATPTPGVNNSERVDGITRDTTFNVDRGLRDTAFDLEIATDTPDAIIRYTTDGTAPTPTSGIIYNGAFNISQTTVIRAIAYKEGFLSTNVDTQSYIFPEDVLEQDDMSTIYTQSALYAPQILQALSEIPTISLSFADSNIDRTEIPISVELLNFESGNEQLDAGAARFGSFVTDFAKRSFRLHFRSRYGPSRLEFPLFDDGTDYNIAPVESFDSLDIRGGNHDIVDRGAYLSNRFTDDTMIEMGNISPHGRFVHIYFNGIYQGMYHLRERWDAAMASDYLPGDEEEFDTLNVNNSGSEFGNIGLQEIQDGDLTDWVAMRNRLAQPNPYEGVKDDLDIPNLLDFMLTWAYGNSESEFRSAGSLENDVGFVFFMKDADGYLRTPANNHPVTHNGPISALTALRDEGNPDFQTLQADRIHKHYFNNGALTVESSIARLEHRIEETTLPFIAEVARWPTVPRPGNLTRANHTPTQWVAFQNNLINNHFENVFTSRLAALRSAGYYPDIIAPHFSQFGGSLSPDQDLVMSTDAQTIYYTLDGSDPRLPGGAISGNAILATYQSNPPSAEEFVSSGDIWNYLADGSDQGTAWRQTNYDDSSWLSGPSELGYGENDQETETGFIDTDPNTSGSQRNATTYFRHTVNIPSPSNFSFFTLGLLYDDAAAVYINGEEVARTANLPANATFETFALSPTPGENAFEDFQIPVSSLINGDNIIAVELHNSNPNNSDTSFDLTLTGEIDLTNGDQFTEPISLTSAGQVRARAFNTDTNEWSALTEAFFSLNSVPASSTNLIISEVHYHPADPETEGELLVSDDDDDFEFIEILNTSNQAVDLTDVSFTDGITYSFDDNLILAPLEYLVLVSNEDAFEERYGSTLNVLEYSGNLRNSGEQIVLESLTAGAIHSFTYGDGSPWPSAPDGEGTSLILANPFGNPDLDEPSNWTINSLIHGNPGAFDTIATGTFAAWRNDNNVTNDLSDEDNDGITALLEYAFGTSPIIPNNAELPELQTVEVDGQNFLALSFPRNTLATDLTFQLESSTNLVDWTDESQVEETPNLLRLVTPASENERQFIRLKVRVN